MSGDPDKEEGDVPSNATVALSDVSPQDVTTLNSPTSPTVAIADAAALTDSQPISDPGAVNSTGLATGMQKEKSEENIASAVEQPLPLASALNAASKKAPEGQVKQKDSPTNPKLEEFSKKGQEGEGLGESLRKAVAATLKKGQIFFGNMREIVKNRMGQAGPLKNNVDPPDGNQSFAQMVIDGIKDGIKGGIKNLFKPKPSPGEKNKEKEKGFDDIPTLPEKSPPPGGEPVSPKSPLYNLDNAANKAAISASSSLPDPANGNGEGLPPTDLTRQSGVGVPKPTDNRTPDDAASPTPPSPGSKSEDAKKLGMKPS